MTGWLLRDLCDAAPQARLNAGVALYDRALLVTVLTYHQRKTSQFCACGWGKLGASHAQHIADAYENETVPMTDELHDEFAVLKLPDKQITSLGATFRTFEEAQQWRDELYRRKEEMRQKAEELEREYGAAETRTSHPTTTEPIYLWNRQWKDAEFVVVQRQFTAWARVGANIAG